MEHNSAKSRRLQKLVEMSYDLRAWERLEGIPDGCAECFPFEIIDELEREYLGKV